MEKRKKGKKCAAVSKAMVTERFDLETNVVVIFVAVAAKESKSKQTSVER